MAPAETAGGSPSELAHAPVSYAAGSRRDAALADLRESFKAAMVSMRQMRGRETRLHGEKLSYAQFGLLFSMQENACVSARELAQSAALSPGTVAQMLDGLEASGLVERRRSTEDKRVVITALTDHGRELLEARRAQMEPRWLAVLSTFTDEELQAASGVLTALAGYFDDTQ